MTICEDCGDECRRRSKCNNCKKLVCAYCANHVHDTSKSRKPKSRTKQLYVGNEGLVKHSFNTEQFVSYVRSKRGDKTIREAVREMGGTISISTLSRVERGFTPDVKTLFSICDWLGVSTSNFITCDLDAGLPNHEISPVDRIRLILLGSKRFDPDIVAALVTLVEKLHKPTGA